MDSNCVFLLLLANLLAHWHKPITPVGIASVEVWHTIGTCAGTEWHNSKSYKKYVESEQMHTMEISLNCKLVYGKTET